MSIMRVILFVLMITTPFVSHAVVPAWQIINKESSINFTATQNNSPVKGQFTSFTGEINADPNQLDASHVRIVVDLASVSTSYGEVADTLKTSDWFNVKLFPQAIFEAKQFTKMGKNSYQANGTLRIRDKTLPVILNFTQEEDATGKARVTGSTHLQRTAFGVGQGEWKQTDDIKDDVQVDFVLTAVKK